VALTQRGLPVPSTSTIRRILHHHGLITGQPRKRPKSSYRRFEAAQPNECWQSDFTHWPLADGTDIEILSWLDDHSRLLLIITAYRRVTVGDVVASFTDTADTYGLPAATLTDNGSVYTSRFTHGHNDFERLIASLGVTQRSGHPGHPQTQGKICEDLERRCTGSV
jgi:transposase InsO family protein